jgi:hypothetical protein
MAGIRPSWRLFQALPLERAIAALAAAAGMRVKKWTPRFPATGGISFRRVPFQRPALISPMLRETCYPAGRGGARAATHDRSPPLMKEWALTSEWYVVRAPVQ